MIFLPLSFVVALLFLTFLLRMIRQDEPRLALQSPFFWLLLIMCVQSIVVGLRWGYDVMAVRSVMPVLAAIIPPLSFIAFQSLTEAGSRLRWRDLLHAIPSSLVLVLLVFDGGPIDLVIILTFLGYGLALLWLARQGPEALGASRLDGMIRSYRALLLMAASLIASAISDLAISLDFAFASGRQAPLIISGFTTIVLLIIGLAAVQAQGETVSGEEQEEVAEVTPSDLPDERAPTAEDQQLAKALDRLMAEQQLYKDMDLNLRKLARRLGQPVRAVSQAVNRVHGMSLSHYVNNHRIAEACRLLQETQEPVTRIMLEAGFMTKSNFNREFLRVTGENPSQWRKRRDAFDRNGGEPGIRA
ncbi:helix-turn-helix domain-containing protein [Allorhizobium sp. BGMRC 0089]|uniref:helix-turn-helix domain-containing protein n=1 Tax=Allorhizobium sonneratiae TaxID=2934936 RepID=UPI0020338B69|nr:AraC family transcriptional regulator [Allorhizobium sonneratiae]MCM2291859.1 helix-turn-helix domain-containing protein [Allorhizobium sonneratiae]